jgi:tRNA threonylcarbamoyladenosine biosynthesis protein TsaE
MNNVERSLAGVAATERLGIALAHALGSGGAVLFLQGELGTGKTTLARALLQALGYTGHVRSPSYTLVEPYEIGGRPVFHLDLYRLTAPEQLEDLGLRDLEPERDLILVEWPERGTGRLPAADLVIRLTHAGAGREVTLSPLTKRGTTILSGLLSSSHPI